MSASDYFGCGESSTLYTKVYDGNELPHFHSLSLYLGAFADGWASSGADFFQVQITTSHHRLVLFPSPKLQPLPRLLLPRQATLPVLINPRYL